MTKPSASIRKIAGQLLAVEAARRTDADEHEALLVCEKLREALTRLAGAEGFTALMRRALALARLDVLALEHVTLGADGCFVGLENAVSGNGNAANAGTEITSQFLWLLVTFVGEPLSIQLVREIWPDEMIDE